MAKIFMHKGKLYSVSDKNQLNEYVVLKMGEGRKVEAAKIIPAKNEEQVEMIVKTYNFEMFKNVPS